MLWCSYTLCFTRTPSRLRRINPTPVGKVTTVFQATSGSPLFNAGLSTGSSTSLQEERRLLVEERSRQLNKFGKKHNRRTEIKSSAQEGHVINTDTVAREKDIVVTKEDHINDDVNVPSLSTVTDKVLLDSIAHCYSSLLKGIPSLTTI